MRWFGWFRRRDPLVRGLYRYHDGRRWRLGDPLRIDPLLKRHGGENWSDLLAVVRTAAESSASGRLARIAAAQQEQAVLSLADLSRKAFDLQPLSDDGSGLGDAEALNVLAGYIGFVQELKERWGPLPNLPARPACPSPSEQDTGEWFPSTSPCPASGSDGPTS